VQFLKQLSIEPASGFLLTLFGKVVIDAARRNAGGTICVDKNLIAIKYLRRIISNEPKVVFEDRS